MAPECLRSRKPGHAGHKAGAQAITPTLSGERSSVLLIHCGVINFRSGEGGTCSCLEILNHKPIRMARGEIPARRDAARAIDYRGAVRRKPICEFVERIDIKIFARRSQATPCRPS